MASFPSVYPKLRDDLFVGAIIMARGSKDGRGGVRVGVVSPLETLFEVMAEQEDE